MSVETQQQIGTTSQVNRLTFDPLASLVFILGDAFLEVLSHVLMTALSEFWPGPMGVDLPTPNGRGSLKGTNLSMRWISISLQ